MKVNNKLCGRQWDHCFPCKCDLDFRAGPKITSHSDTHSYSHTLLMFGYSLCSFVMTDFQIDKAGGNHVHRYR